MLTCKQVTELVTAYAEGQLSLLDRIRFWFHILECRACRTYVRQLRATALALGELPEPEIAPEMMVELLQRFEGWKGRR